LNWQKIGMLVILYGVFVLVLTVPSSLWDHQFMRPPVPVMIAAVGIAVVGALGIDVVHRVHHAGMGVAADDPSPRSEHWVWARPGVRIPRACVPQPQNLSGTAGA